MICKVNFVWSKTKTFHRICYEIRKFTMVLILEWCHSVLAEARGKEKATIGAVCKRCGRWWDPWLNFDPFVMVLTGGAVHEGQPCLFNPEMWLHFGCANEANDFQFDILLLKTEQLAQQKCWVQTVFCQGLLLEMFYWLIYLSTIIKNGLFLKMCSFLFNLGISIEFQPQPTSKTCEHKPADPPR